MSSRIIGRGRGDRPSAADRPPLRAADPPRDAKTSADGRTSRAVTGLAALSLAVGARRHRGGGRYHGHRHRVCQRGFHPVRAETERVRRMISEGRPGVRKVSRLLAGSLTTRRTRLDAE